LPPWEIDLQNCFENQSDHRAELFQKQIRSERYLISKTLIVCKMIKYNLVKGTYAYIVCIYVKIEDAWRPDHPKFWGTNIILAFVLMSYSSFIMKVVMIG
jgi:hypothetical protein